MSPTTISVDRPPRSVPCHDSLAYWWDRLLDAVIRYCHGSSLSRSTDWKHPRLGRPSTHTDTDAVSVTICPLRHASVSSCVWRDNVYTVYRVSALCTACVCRSLMKRRSAEITHCRSCLCLPLRGSSSESTYVFVNETNRRRDGRTYRHKDGAADGDGQLTEEASVRRRSRVDWMMSWWLNQSRVVERRLLTHQDTTSHTISPTLAAPRLYRLFVSFPLFLFQLTADVRTILFSKKWYKS